jgi:putative oxidoreductase
MSFSETISPFFGRCAFVWFYVTSGMEMLGNWHQVAQSLADKQVPVAPIFMVVALLLIFMGSISLLFGYHTKHGAMLLFALSMVGAVTLHDFWHYTDPVARAREFEIFARDFAICGGLLLLVGMGPGPFAVDNQPKGGGGGGKKR